MIYFLSDVAVLKSQVESLSRKTSGDRADFKRVIEEKEAAEMKIVELRALISNIEISSRNTGYKCNKLEAALTGNSQHHLLCLLCFIYLIPRYQ